MKKEYLRVISEYLELFPVRINSNLLSAQNRDRWYWTNIKTKDVGLFSELWTDIPQPEDKEILLKDILQPESEVNEKYYLSNKMIDFIDRRTKSNKGKRGIAHLSDGTDKSKCLTEGRLRDSSATFICVSMVGRRVDENGIRKDNDKSIPAVQRLEPVESGNKTNCLTSVAKDNLILQVNPSKESGGVQPYQQNRVYNINGQMPALNAQLGGRNNITDGYKLRRLTPREAGYLQTFTKEEMDVLLASGISDTQLYRMLGNGWTVDVIAWILSFMK